MRVVEKIPIFDGRRQSQAIVDTARRIYLRVRGPYGACTCGVPAAIFGRPQLSRVPCMTCVESAEQVSDLYLYRAVQASVTYVFATRAGHSHVTRKSRTIFALVPCAPAERRREE